MGTDSRSYTDSYRLLLVLVTIGGKVAAIAFGAYAAYSVYVAGLEWLAIGIVVGGGGAAIVHTVSAWRAGHRPWYPTKRETATEFDDPDYLRRGAAVGGVAGGLTLLVLWAYATYRVHQAGLESLAIASVLVGGGYVAIRLATDLKAGRKPWMPTKRVRRFDEED